MYSMPLSERPVVVNESQKGEENWVALFLVCMLQSSLYFLFRGEAEGMDGKCSVIKRRAAPASRTSARLPPRCAKTLQVSQLQRDPEVLKREWLVTCHSDDRENQAEPQWTLAPSSGKGFISLAE